jgi:hypothetical protein
MNSLLSQLAGKTVSLQTTSTVYPYLFGYGCFILYGPHKRLKTKPIISFTHIITGQLIYNAEADKYILYDKAGIPWWDVSDLYERDNTIFDLTASIKPEFSTRLEEGNIYTFFNECLKNGLNHKLTEFKEVRKEIKPYLQQKYHVVPKAKGFIDWYIKSKLNSYLNANPILLNYLQYFAAKEFMTTINGKVHFQVDSLPIITQKDIQEYCFFFNQSLEANNQILVEDLVNTQKLLPTALAGNNTAMNKPEQTYIWRGQISENLNQLDDLYHLLNEKYLQGSILAFRGIFGNGPYLGPIVWKATDSALIWLLLELQEYNFLDKPSRQNWAMLSTFFIGVKKSYSPNNLKVVKSNLHKNLGKEVKLEISAIVRSIHQ